MSAWLRIHAVDHPAYAVEWLHEVITLLVALGASAQVGRCWCGRVVPWERAYVHSDDWRWCYACVPEQPEDVRKRNQLEHKARTGATR